MKKMFLWSGVLCLAGLLICVGILCALGFDSMRLDTAGTNSGTLNIVGDSADWLSINHIDINGMSCDVTVCPAPDGEARVEYDTPGYIDVTAVVDGNRLVITGTESRQPWYKRIRLEIRPHKGITVYLPTYVASHSFETLNIRTGSGDILVWGNLVAGEAKVTTASGDVDFRIDTQKSLTISSASGDVALSLFTGRDVTVATTSGDIAMERLNVQGQVRIKSVSGDLSTEEVSVIQSFAAETTSGTLNVRRTEAPYFTAATVSGDIELEKSGGTILMGLQTTSGEVEVDAIKTYKLYTSSVSGEIRVKGHRQVDEQLSNCKIYTVSGDITVK